MCKNYGIFSVLDYLYIYVFKKKKGKKRYKGHNLFIHTRRFRFFVCFLKEIHYSCCYFTYLLGEAGCNVLILMCFCTLFWFSLAVSADSLVKMFLYGANRGFH